MQYLFLGDDCCFDLLCILFSFILSFLLTLHSLLFRDASGFQVFDPLQFVLLGLLLKPLFLICNFFLNQEINVLLTLIHDVVQELLVFLLSCQSRSHPDKQVVQLGSHQLQSVLHSIQEGLVFWCWLREVNFELFQRVWMIEHCQDEELLYSLPLLLVFCLKTRSASLVQELLRVSY